MRQGVFDRMGDRCVFSCIFVLIKLSVRCLMFAYHTVPCFSQQDPDIPEERI